MKRRTQTAILLLIGIALALPARAHMVSTGIGPFYDGLSHVFVTPIDLLCIAAAILLAGLAGLPFARRAFLAMIFAWCVGTVAGAALFENEQPQSPLFAALLILLGGMAALDRRWPPAFLMCLLITLNTLLAFSAGAGQLAEPDAPQRILGLLVGVGIVLTLGTAFAVSRPSTWQRIALRVAGSWLIAIGLLALALQKIGTVTY